MPARRTSVLAALLLVLPGAAAAQQPAATLAPAADRPLSLGDILTLARRNNPSLRTSAAALAPARASVRNAYASFLPTLGVSGGAGYTGSGQSQFGAFFAQTSPFITSSYSIGLAWSFDGRVLAQPAQAKAAEAAADADLAATTNAVTADVTRQYLATLQAQAQVEVARAQVTRNGEFLALAQARYRVGQANLLDVKQAEVARGNSEVTLLGAEQRLAEQKYELFRRAGTTPPAEIAAVALADSFVVAEPSWQRDELVRLAMDIHPEIAARRARVRAADAAVRAAKSEYLPSVSASAGWSGFTQQFTNTNLLIGNATATAQANLRQCPFTNTAIDLGVQAGPRLDCTPGAYGLDASGTALSEAQAAAIRDRNSVFPFDFKAQPFQANLVVRLPIWDAFGRNVRVQQARAQAITADENVRARELQAQADVGSVLSSVQTAYRTVAVQARNRDTARDQLQLAQDRYRVGAGTSLEVTDAQAAVARAEGDYVNAVYNYHIAVAGLELVVGRPLR